MISKRIKQSVLAVLTLSLALSLFSGCGSKPAKDSGAPASNTTQTKAAAPRKVSFMTQSFGENPAPDHFILKAIQEATNTVLDIMWVPSSNYVDKVNVVIASGDMPNIMLVTDTKASSFIGAVKQGAFWEVGPYLKDYPIYLAKMDPTRLKNSQIDGKNYGLFRKRPLGRTGYTYRKDWLKNLGLKEPETIEDFYNMLKAFTFNDPDKNGKDDTIGAVADKAQSFGHLIAPFGAGNTWYIDKNGNVRPSAEQKEYIEGLKFIKKLYAEKLINQDFLVAPDSGALFKKANAGVRLGGMIDDISAYQSEIIKSVPTAEVDGISKLKGPAGAQTFGSGEGFNGWYVFPKPSNKKEEDLRAMLAFFDKITDPKAAGNAVLWGKEGDHYSLVDGKAVRSKEQRDKWTKDSYSLPQVGLNADGLNGEIVSGDPLDKRIKELYAKNEKDGMVADPTMGFSSPTYIEKRTELRSILSDAVGKFIIGTIDEAGYMKEIDKFMQNGGKKVCDEFTEILAKSKK